MRAVRGAGVVLCVALASACGTTVDLSRQSGSAAGVGPGAAAAELGPPPASVAAGVLGPGRTVPDAPLTARAGAAGAFDTLAAEQLARSAARGPRQARRPAPGLLRVGVVWSTDRAGLANSLALKIDPGDVRGALRGVAADINRRGGVSGRRLVLVPHEEDVLAAANDPTAAAGRICAKFTEDDPVDVVMSGLSPTSIPALFACLAKRDTPLLAIDANPHSQRTEFGPFARHLYHPSTVAVERLVPTWVARLDRMRYFRPWDTALGAPGEAPVRVGIVHQTGNEPFAAALRAALRRAGQSAPEVVEYSDFEDAGQNMAQYAIHLKGKGVTHVFIDKPVTTVLFTSAAESQVYRPRYGLTTFNGPTLGLTAQPAVPKAQLRGALAVGFLPLVDAADPQLPAGPGTVAHRCAQAARAAAAKPPHDAFSRQAQLVQCEALLLMDAAFEAGGEISTEGLRRGMERTGVVRPAASHAGFLIDADKHDAVAFVRDLEYVEADNRFVYRSQAVRLP